MAWIRVESSVARNRKFVKAGPAPSWLWLCGLAYCQEGLTDGFIPSEALNYLGVKNAKQLAAHLVAAGLWDVVDGGWQVHDYLEHNKPASEVRRIQDERRDAGQNGGKASGVARRSKPEPFASAPVEANAKQTANPSLTATATSTATAQTPRPATLIAPYRQSTNNAHVSPSCGNVPLFLHQEFVGKVMGAGGDEGDADKQVRAFYADTETRFTGQVVGDEPLKFWRAQFAARSKPAKAMSDSSAMVFATLGMKP